MTINLDKWRTVKDRVYKLRATLDAGWGDCQWTEERRDWTRWKKVFETGKGSNNLPRFTPLKKTVKFMLLEVMGGRVFDGLLARPSRL